MIFASDNCMIYGGAYEIDLIEFFGWGFKVLELKYLMKSFKFGFLKFNIYILFFYNFKFLKIPLFRHFLK